MTAHPLDELREQLVALKVHPDEIWGGPDWNGAIDEAEAILDAFTEAHPGLVDLTTRCLTCNKPINRSTSPSVNNVVTGEYIGEVCAECYEKVTT
jgi:hypothetical protein